jgi:uncharacterized protein
VLPPTFSRAAVAALFLERQHLDRPRGRTLGAASLERFVADVGGLQLDSIHVVDRAHWLTLWSRFGELDRRRFERLAYGRRLLFEYWAHAACLVPTADFPAWRRVMNDYRTRDRGWSSWLRENPRLLAEVEGAIRTRGPLSNADFEGAKPGGASGWWSWKPATHALDFLWMSGRTLVHSRTHFRKRYDLAERVLPAHVGAEPLSAAEFRRWHLRRSLRALGAATESDLRMYLTFPRIPAPERRRMLEDALRRGEVVEIRVAEDRARWFALAADLEPLARAGRRRSPSRGTTLLSPFDSFLWYRERTKRLFDFDYRIEVYTPAAKRTHGYYAMPILHDGRLVGRVDAKTHREEGRFEVRRVTLEGGAAAVDPGELASGVADALRSLARFVGAPRIELREVVPAGRAPSLRRALREPPPGAEIRLRP